jgi:mRNA interferase RelE/StbE
MSGKADTRLFAIAEAGEFRRQLSNLPPSEQTQIRKKLATYVYPLIRENPFSGPNIKRLSNYSPPTWRYRIGPYRIFYEISPTVVFITAIHKRRDAYR